MKYQVEFYENHIPSLADLIKRNYPIGELMPEEKKASTTQPAGVPPPNPPTAENKNPVQYLSDLAEKLNALSKELNLKATELANAYDKKKQGMNQEANRESQAKEIKSSLVERREAKLERNWDNFGDCVRAGLDIFYTAHDSLPLKQCIRAIPENEIPASFAISPFVEPSELALFLRETSVSQGKNLQWSIPYFHSGITGVSHETARKMWMWTRLHPNSEALEEFFRLMLWNKKFRKLYKENDLSPISTSYGAFCSELKKLFDSRGAFFENIGEPLCH